MNVPLALGTGLTRRKLKKPGVKGSKFSSTKGDNKGRPPKTVSYCPECPVLLADPEKSPHVPATTARVGLCKVGHRWLIGGRSYLGGANYGEGQG